MNRTRNAHICNTQVRESSRNRRGGDNKCSKPEGGRHFQYPLTSKIGKTVRETVLLKFSVGGPKERGGWGRCINKRYAVARGSQWKNVTHQEVIPRISRKLWKGGGLVPVESNSDGS